MTRKITLKQERKLKGLSDAKKISELSDDEIEKIIAGDPDLNALADDDLSEFALARKK
jgi:hypothetical protein